MKNTKITADNALFRDLCDASRNGDAQAILNLIDQGADPLRSIDISRMSPLQIAASEGHLDAVKALLPFSDTRHQDQYGRTALMIAAQETYPQHADIYFELLPHSDPAMTDNEGDTLLHYATSSESSEIIQSALTFCDPNATDIHGDTPLHAAAYAGCELHALIATAQNVRHKNSFGFTPADIYRNGGYDEDATELEQRADALAEHAELHQALPHKTPGSGSKNKL